MMSIDDLKDKVSKVAPALGVMLDGPTSGIALANLGRELLDDDSADVDRIVAATEPDDASSAAKIKEAEAQTFEQLASAAGGVAQASIDAGSAAKRLDTIVALEKAADEDRASARVRQKDAKDWWINPILALVVTIGFFAVLWYTIGRPSKADGAGVGSIAQTLLGVLGTAWVGIINFYFGSSAGSKSKTQILATQLDKKP